MAYLRTIMIPAALALIGCLEYHATITIRPDGSGELEQTVMLTNEMLAMTGPSTKERFRAIDNESLRKGAARLGDGVELASAKPWATGTHTGYRVNYRFADINSIRAPLFPDESVTSVDTGPTDDVPNDGGSIGDVSFAFSPGEVARLTAYLPEEGPPNNGTALESRAGTGDGSLEVWAPFFAGMRIVIRLVFDGEIVESSATHVDGSTVTLIDLDYGSLFANPEILRRLSDEGRDINRRSDMARAGIPGIVVEPQSRILIGFR